jgi:hypothetical protein
MDEFPSNSKRQRREEPQERSKEVKIARVVHSEVVRRKKPLGKRLREMVIGDEETSVSEYLLAEVLIPNIKDLLYDLTTMGVERRLYGDVRPSSRRHRRPGGGGGDNFRYDRVSRERDSRPQLSRQARARHDFGEIVIPTRAEALEVLDGMYDLLEKYEQVTVGNLLEMVGEPSHYTDERYGWTDLQGSGVRRVPGGGFLLDLPRTEDLER